MIILFSTACTPQPVHLSDITVTEHPTVSTLLAVHWQQDVEAAAWLEYSIDGQWRSSPARSLAAGAQSEWILGAPSLADVTWRVVAERDGEQTISDARTTQTGALPDALPEPELATWVPESTSEAGWVLASLDVDGGSAYSGPFWLVIADRQGRIVWYLDLEYQQSMFPRVAADGSHIAFDSYSLLDATGAGARIRRLSLDGQYAEETATPGLGWCWDELPDGTLLYDQSKGTEALTLQEIAPDGTQRMVWDCSAWMAPVDPEPDHCYTNTVNWVEETDSILWSTYWGDYVVEVDRLSGQVLWYAGALEGGWEISPEEAGLDLQHYPNYTPDGSLLISTHVPGEEGEQRAREYTLDADTQTLTEIWSYGEGAEGYAKYSGEAVRLESGHTLLNYGTGGEIRELDLTGETVWSLQWGEGFTLGHSELIGDLYALNTGR